MGGAAADILAEMESLQATNETSVSPDKVVMASRPVETDESHITAVTVLPESGKPSYQITLAEALRHQAVSDSLKDLASAARVSVRESDDPND